MGMRMRWMAVLVMLVSILGLAPTNASAANGDTAEAAEVARPDMNREQILQTIETTRQTDPELAAEMERQLELFDSGELDLQDHDTLTPPSESADGLPSGAPELIGPPVETGGSGQDPRFEAVQSDPRMQELHERFESGELTEDEAREQVFDILRDHGIEPDNGREWEHPEGAFEHGLELERGEGFEHMAPEAREQLEHDMLERTYETLEHEYEAPAHEYETLEHEYEAPAYEYEAPEQESPEHKMQFPPEQDYDHEVPPQ